MVTDDGGEMVGNFSDDVSAVLFVDPGTVRTEYTAFVAELKKTRASSLKNRRNLYAEYVPIIGANGVLDGITELWPKCHSEAHDLGKVIFGKTGDMSVSLQVCRDGCYSGCMHGVLMEAFAGARTSAQADPEQHVDVDIVKSLMEDICSKNSTMTSAYSPGDCAHATGHALMVLADYRVSEAIRYCDDFGSDPMRYYCATGAYMEYITERDIIDTTVGRRTFYPCDTGRYPAACMRYKMPHVIGRLVKKKQDVEPFMRRCDEFAGVVRIGCYHGAGNGYMSLIAGERITLQDVCGQGTDDERAACIDGAMERMAKYYPDRAAEVCRDLPSGSFERKICGEAAGRGMYNMEKDLSLYVE